MAVCARCAAPLVATARFCAACGSPVTRSATAPVVSTPESRPDSRGPTVAVPAVPEAPTAAQAQAPDPFASTVMGDPAALAAINAVRAASEPRVRTAPITAVAAARPNPVSPMASSVMRTPGDPQPSVQSPQASMPTPWNVGVVGTPAPYAPSAPAANPYMPGVMVLVQWSNGQRYAGTVLQTSGSQVLVTFPNGQQHWVDVKYVSVGV